MTVTKIEAAAKTRYKVYIDGQFAFVLYKGELSRYHLSEGDEIEGEVYRRIRTDVIVKRAKLRAMHLLNDMGRTETQLKQKLRQGNYTEDVIEEAVAYVKSFGYINDEEYARSFIESRKEKKSRKEIYAQLCQKGLDKEVIERAFEDFYDSDDSKEAIKALMRKRNYDPETADAAETRRLLAYLMRKGFNYEDIRHVVQVSEWNA